MNATCDTCKWWQDTNGLQKATGELDLVSGDCGNPAVVDDSGIPGNQTGVRISDRDFQTEPKFGCRHHVQQGQDTRTEKLRAAAQEKQAAELKKARATIRRLKLEVANFNAFCNNPPSPSEPV